MKKILFSALILSLLLATLTACGAEAQQPTTPEPTPEIEQSEPVAKPEPLAAPEKAEISQEELEPIFEQVYTEASENHPEDWSVDFQITDEIGKITKAIPDDKKAPANLREIYIEWRTAKTEPDTAEPEPEPIPESEPEPIPEPESEAVPQQPTTNNDTPSIQDTDSNAQQNNTGNEYIYEDDIESSDDWRDNILDLPNVVDPAGGSYIDSSTISGSIGG